MVFNRIFSWNSHGVVVHFTCMFYARKKIGGFLCMQESFFAGFFYHFLSFIFIKTKLILVVGYFLPHKNNSFALKRLAIVNFLSQVIPFNDTSKISLCTLLLWRKDTSKRFCNYLNLRIVRFKIAQEILLISCTCNMDFL